MKTIALPATSAFGSKPLALGLAVIVTFLAALAATPVVRAEEPAAAPAKTALPPVNHLVYLAQLPTPSSLMKEAKAQGTTIERIDRTDDSLVVVYKYADGHTDTFGYTTLAAASTEEQPAVMAQATVGPSTAIVVAAPPPRTYTVVSYRDPAPVYYETRYSRDYYEPFWAPLALGIGIGWVTGGHGGYHYHGPSHGWRR